MQVIKTRKFKLKLNATQKETLDKWISVSCLVYNVALEAKQMAYKDAKAYNGTPINLTAYDLQKQITELRANFDFVAELPSCSLATITERLDNAFKKFFKEGAGFPKFKKRKFYKSIGFKSVKRVSENAFKLPKIGILKIHKDNLPIEAELRTATITQVNKDIYYLSVSYKIDVSELPKTGNATGLDFGIKYVVADATGNKILNPQHAEKALQKLRVAQRKLARRVKGSANWLEAKRQVAKIHQKVKRQKEWLYHQIANYYVKEFDHIGIENLKISNMLKNRNLARHIAGVSWYDLRLKLEYKAKWAGKMVVPVAPNYTSQACNSCGEINAESRVSQSLYVCVNCGHTDNADVNAAKNIMLKSLKLAENKSK